ncbi:MAG TPA: hypothetical protein VM553_15880 [Dongiaceae bacterium]|nr:hypothetical protein [Dongiaceae bacterium]
MKKSLRLPMTAALAAAALSGCYDPSGPIPEERKSGTAPQWTDADVAEVVQVTYESVPATFVIQHPQLPAGCNDVRFLRFKTRDSGNDPAQADAALLLVPGVLEGANGFEYIGRQLVYMAKTQRGRNVEIWAMDRRSNCLEDLRGMQAAEAAPTVAEAEDLIVGYYYGDLSIDGQPFAGFSKSKDMPYLIDFGMQQTTEDMYAVLKAMVPDIAVSRKKVFVGGHSLGGIHTSMFLSWDLDADPATTDDIGANLVAGAIGFDTDIGPLSDPAGALQAYAPIADTLLADADVDSDAGYRNILKLIRTGILPKNIDIPALFSAEAIALPEAVGLLAAKAPDQESRVIDRIPKSPALNSLFRFFHTRDANNYAYGPHLESFRYTNAAQVGLMFDEHYSILSFLQASLGQMNGGAVVKKSPLVQFGRSIPILKDLIAAISGPKQQFIAADAGPDRAHLRQGPLYRWANADQIGDAADPDYTDTTGTFKYTDIQDEMVRMEDFTRALHVGPTNLTEWYFPMRILIDMLAAGKTYGPAYGIKAIHPGKVLEVPTVIFAAGDGLALGRQGEPIPGRPFELIVLPGQSHLDPMFATVNTPQLHKNEVADNLLDFMFEHAQQ